METVRFVKGIKQRWMGTEQCELEDVPEILMSTLLDSDREARLGGLCTARLSPEPMVWGGSLT
jgi:hypothetical protein